jgi:hypothetical protein
MLSRNSGGSILFLDVQLNSSSVYWADQLYGCPHALLASFTGARQGKSCNFIHVTHLVDAWELCSMRKCSDLDSAAWSAERGNAHSCLWLKPAGLDSFVPMAAGPAPLPVLTSQHLLTCLYSRSIWHCNCQQSPVVPAASSCASNNYQSHMPWSPLLQICARSHAAGYGCSRTATALNRDAP